jgi:hypothetical protein
MLLTGIKEIERRIKWPTARWDGNCYAVAVAIFKAKLVPAKSHVRYGVWHGPIASTSSFAGRPFTHHGWIELPDGQIYDPTRFVFEAQRPYIWIGTDENGYYDVAGQRLNKIFYRECPDAEEKPVKLTDRQRRVLGQFLPSVCKRDPDFGQLMWLGNMPPDEMNGQAKDVYTVLEELKLSALIPLDFRRYVLEDDKVYA